MSQKKKTFFFPHHIFLCTSSLLPQLQLTQIFLFRVTSKNIFLFCAFLNTHTQVTIATQNLHRKKCVRRIFIHKIIFFLLLLRTCAEIFYEWIWDLRDWNRCEPSTNELWTKTEECWVSKQKSDTWSDMDI